MDPNTPPDPVETDGSKDDKAGRNRRRWTLWAAAGLGVVLVAGVAVTRLASRSHDKIIVAPVRVTIPAHRDANREQPWSQMVAAPDGTLVVANGSLGPVEFLSPEDGKPTRPPLDDIKFGIQALAVSRERVAVAPSDDEVRIYDYRHPGPPLRRIKGRGVGEYIFNLAFSHDGFRLAVQMGDAVEVVGTEDGAAKWMDEPPIGQDRDILQLTFSPDDSLLAVAVHESIELHAASDGKLVRTLSATRSGYYAIAFSPDGTRLAALSMQEGFRMFRVADGTLLFDDGYSGDKKDNGMSSLTWIPGTERLLGMGRRGQIIVHSASGPEFQVVAPASGAEPWTKLERLALVPGTRAVAFTSMALDDWAIRVLDLPDSLAR